MKDSMVKELKLAKFCHDCDWRISRPFTCILNAQKSLREITCFKLADWEFYAGVILKNRHALRSVKIEKNLAPEIDLKAFSSCKNLEHLWISQYSSSHFGQHQSWFPHAIRVDQRLINLKHLPTSLKSLHILDQTVEAAQIKSIPQRLKKLEILDLQFLGTWDGKSFGMCTETVSEILHLRSLKCLFLEEIRTIEAYIAHSLNSSLSEINLIPAECSQIIKSYGCVVCGILIAEKLPCADFMSEWQPRVSCYLENNVCNPEDIPFYGHHDELLTDNSDEGEELDNWDRESEEERNNQAP